MHALTSTTLSIGFIGGGLDSAVGEAHKVAAQMDGRWRVAAGCFSRDQAVNHQTAEAWGVARNRVYTCHKELLEHERGLDAVAVLTPTPSHADIVLDALDAGYAVVCEKALASSVEDARRIRDAVRHAQAYLAVIYNYTGYPMVRELRAMIASGRLGNIQQIHAEMPQETFLKHGVNPQDWRLKDQDIPTCSLDLGVHLHHLIAFLTGERPNRVMAIHNNYGKFNGIIDNIMCLARYTGNIDCSIWYGKVALGHTNGLRVRVYGEKGSAEWFQMQPELLVLSDDQGRKQQLERSCVDLEIANQKRYNRFKAGHPAGFIEALANHYFDLADSLVDYRQGRSSPGTELYDVDVAGEGLAMLHAIVQSARTEEWQAVEMWS